MNIVEQKIVKLRAITLWRPWPVAVALMGKPIENRTWDAWLRQGEWVAVHAGKKWDANGVRWIERVIRPTDRSLLDPQHPMNAPGVVAVARFKGCVTASDSPWFTGPVGWQFDRRIPFSQPVDCPGRQGIWTMSEVDRDRVLRAAQHRPLLDFADR